MPARLVLIDDHQILRDGLRLHLAQAPELVVAGDAGSAAEARALLEKTPADLAIVDLGLPDVEELSFVQELRRRWPNLRVIVLTGRSEGRLVEEALVAGVSGFLRKENTTRMLRDAISEALAGRVFICPESAAALAATLRARSAARPAQDLSSQEVKLLRGIAAGLSYKELSVELKVTPKSVETYRRRLARKLGLSTRAELVRFAVDEGLARFGQRPV